MWSDTQKHFGSGKLSLGDILAPAIELADEGVPISEIASYNVSALSHRSSLAYQADILIKWQNGERELSEASPNGHEMLLPSGKAPKPGQIFRNPCLAQTFRDLATKGTDGFYKGRVAEAIVECRLFLLL
jgi:gamma-glutamyltranspeptidase/glutathione hydrolase